MPHSLYRAAIARLTDADPALVEGWMRLQYHTLDHLDHATFVAEVRMAEACIAEDPDGSRRLAESFGLTPA